MNNTELKPCPFCGKSAFTMLEEFSSGDKAWYVLHWGYEECYIKRCIGDYFDTEEEAVEVWNRRIDDD